MVNRIYAFISAIFIVITLFIAFVIFPKAFDQISPYLAYVSVKAFDLYSVLDKDSPGTTIKIIGMIYTAFSLIVLLIISLIYTHRFLRIPMISVVTLLSIGYIYLGVNVSQFTVGF